MISAVEFHEELEDGFINVRFLPSISEVVVQYSGIDGAIVDEEFSFMSGANVKTNVLAIALRMNVTRNEYQRIYTGMDKFLDVIDDVLA